MIDLSLAGLLGAMVGTVVAGVLYHLFVGVLERAMREREQSAPERDAVEFRLSIVRRTVLTTDLIIFAALGYWLGRIFDA